MNDGLHRVFRTDPKSIVATESISSPKTRNSSSLFATCHISKWPSIAVAMTAVVLSPAIAFAQASPWERAASNLEFTFTGPLARSLALVAIVIGGLMFMFGEAGAKRQISGIVFGGGLALFATQFLAWLF